MTGSRIARLARMTPIAIVTVIALAGFAASSSRSASRKSKLNVSKYLPRRHATAANKGELSIANGSNGAIECKVPRYRDGAAFRVDDQSTRAVRVAEISGEKAIGEVTCQGKTIDGLNVTPGADGEDVAYLADGRFKRSGYIYLHADLRPTERNGCRTAAHQYVDWATTREGFCPGKFAGGSPPFDNTPGLSLWHQEAGGPYLIETALGTPSGWTPNPGLHFECLVVTRSQGDCYTQQSQVGKPRNTQGGPLYIDVHLTSFGEEYILVRGWCEKSDGYCMPHGG
jgi:hypothetical protein